MTTQTGRKLRQNTYGKELRKGNTVPSSGWLWAPARLVLLALAARRLLLLHRSLLTSEAGHVLKVRAALDEKSREVYIYPTVPGDHQGIPVQVAEGGRQITINLDSLLLPDLGLPPGLRQRFEIHLADESASPVGPALVFHLDRPQQTRRRGK